MNNNYNRREFLKFSAAGIGSIGLAGMTSEKKTKAEETSSAGKPLRIGFVGVGDQGSSHLDCALGIDGVQVPALCDIDNAYLYRAKRWVEESGRPTPRLYGKTKTDFVRMCEQEELDVVICATSWEWHVPVCLAAMKNDKHAVTEVPMVQTVDEAWEVVETFESTGKWATLGFKGVHSALSNMIHQGIFGDIIHCEGGYVHDLRLVKFDPEREPWRLQHSINRNGNLYPDHPTCRLMPLMNINHGDRFDYLVSMSSKAAMLNRYAAAYYGDDHPYAKMKMAQGDYNATLIRTANGKLYTLNFDTNTPHPRGFTRVQGTKAVYWRGSGRGSWIYIDGVSPEEHQWEPADKYFKEYAHPAIKNYNPPPRKAIRGHSGGGRRTPIRWHRLVTALREGKTTEFDVYDSVTSSVISPLSEMSVANKSVPVYFPDFTRGKWKTRPSLESL